MASRTGSSSGAEIIGIAEFRRELAQLQPDANWDAAFSLAHQRIASKGAAWSRDRARGMGGVQARAASSIGAKHDARKATIAVLPSALDRMGNVAFWGAKRHTGWYSNVRYRDSAPQHPRWVGSGWDVAVPGQGPYAINDALAVHINDLLDEYADMVSRIAHDAFPGR